MFQDDMQQTVVVLETLRNHGICTMVEQKQSDTPISATDGLMEGHQPSRRLLVKRDACLKHGLDQIEDWELFFIPATEVVQDSPAIVIDLGYLNARLFEKQIHYPLCT
ncbi:hypothetical protein FOVSG1_007258 [Fusarium oxysporum f. sp. vasinfectum]